MAQGSRSLFAATEESRFKRTADGWLMAAPRPWPFSQRLIYRVSEAQKAALIVRLRRARSLRLLIAFLFLAPLAALIATIPAMRNPASPLGWSALVVFMAAVLVASAQCEYWIVSRPLRGLRPTGEQITFGDRLRMQAEAMSLKTHALLAAIFLAAGANAVYRAVVPTHVHSMAPFALAAAVVFALLFLRSVMLIAVKLTQPQDEGT
jgi:hypothetical protein